MLHYMLKAKDRKDIAMSADMTKWQTLKISHIYVEFVPNLAWMMQFDIRLADKHDDEMYRVLVSTDKKIIPKLYSVIGINNLDEDRVCLQELIGKPVRFGLNDKSKLVLASIYDNEQLVIGTYGDWLDEHLDDNGHFIDA